MQTTCLIFEEKNRDIFVVNNFCCCTFVFVCKNESDPIDSDIYSFPPFFISFFPVVIRFDANY